MEVTFEIFLLTLEIFLCTEGCLGQHRSVWWRRWWAAIWGGTNSQKYSITWLLYSKYTRALTYCHLFRRIMTHSDVLWRIMTYHGVLWRIICDRILTYYVPPPPPKEAQILKSQCPVHLLYNGQIESNFENLCLRPRKWHEFSISQKNAAKATVHKSCLNSGF